MCMSAILNGYAQTNPSAQALPYTQGFGSLSHTSTTYPAGWQGWTLGSPGSSFSTSAPTGDRTINASATASVNSGNIHNYNGKLGFLNTGSLDLSLVLAVNTTGRNGVKIQYDIMTIRNPYDGNSNTRINEVILQYRVGTSGSFTSLTGMEYQNNTTTQTTGVTTPQNNSTKLVSLPAACNNQSVVQLRWASRQVSGGGARASFAIDNITVDTALSATVSVAKTQDAAEASSPTAGTFNISFMPATTGSTTLSYNLTGTATFNTDYTVTLSAGATPSTLTNASGSITVPASVSSVVATVTPINDVIAEGVETVKIAISNPSAGYKIGDTNASMNILDDEATYIHDIQGTGTAAIPGTFTVEGIVTGVYSTLSPAGFYMQEEDADADANPATSEGIFVVSTMNVSPGDKVRVTGTAQENGAAPSYQQAVLTAPAISVMSSGNPLPTATVLNLPVTALTDFEQYEGMLVRLPDTLTVTDNYNLGRYGEINLSKGGMVYQPTQRVDHNDATASGTTSSGNSNAAAVAALTQANQLRTIMMDDGVGTMTTLPFVDVNNTLRLGSTTSNVTGILGYAYSVYRLQPVPHAQPVFTYAQRPATVPSVGVAANVKVLSFNVLNYFNGDGNGGGFPTARGAHTMAEFNRQRDKIITAISTIDADVLGLIEMENDGTGTNSALQDLVNGLNAKQGAGTYAYINDGATIQNNSSDAIRCAIVYKPAVVSPVGQAMTSANTAFDRTPLAQAFSYVPNNEKFIFIINHFKSKGCGGSNGADADLGDGQSCYNQRRKNQAGALMDFIKTTVIPAAGTDRVLTVGDYNAYFEEDPMDTMRAEGYTVLGADSSYSYLYFGQVGSLDNAVVNDSMLIKVTGMAKWNINSAEPTYLDYNDVSDDGGSDYSNQWGGLYTNTPFRSSDHDPVIIGLDLSLPVSIASMAANSSYEVYPNPAHNVLYIRSKQNVNAAWMLTDIAGRVVADGQLNGIQNVVDMTSFSNGVYLLQLNSSDGTREVVRVAKH